MAERLPPHADGEPVRVAGPTGLPPGEEGLFGTDLTSDDLARLEEALVDLRVPRGFETNEAASPIEAEATVDPVAARLAAYRGVLAQFHAAAPQVDVPSEVTRRVLDAARAELTASRPAEASGWRRWFWFPTLTLAAGAAAVLLWVVRTPPPSSQAVAERSGVTPPPDAGPASSPSDALPLASPRPTGTVWGPDRLALRDEADRAGADLDAAPGRRPSPAKGERSALEEEDSRGVTGWGRVANGSVESRERRSKKSDGSPSLGRPAAPASRPGGGGMLDDGPVRVPTDASARSSSSVQKVGSGAGGGAVPASPSAAATPDEKPKREAAADEAAAPEAERSGVDEGSRAPQARAPAVSGAEPRSAPAEAKGAIGVRRSELPVFIERADRQRRAGNCASARRGYARGLRSEDLHTQARAEAGLGLCELMASRPQAAQQAFERARAKWPSIDGFIAAERATIPR